jgi:hypothetical protein
MAGFCHQLPSVAQALRVITAGIKIYPGFFPEPN